MRIDGKVAMVTGAASGLGEATVRMLVANGARVAALDLDEDGLVRLASDARLGGAILTARVEASDAPAMESAYSRIRDAFGLPRILVTCAGILGPARVFRIDKETGRAVPRALDDFRRVIEVNLIGTFNPLRLFAAGLATASRVEGEEDAGVVITTASVAAYEALSAQVAYGSSKAGVASMTLPLARELSRHAIRVVSVAPGTFRTGMYDVVPSHTRTRLIADVPFPPRPGRPDEFAHLVRALIENGMMNGSVVRIDGAARMREPSDADKEAAAVQ